jgi:hypothetical protein
MLTDPDVPALPAFTEFQNLYFASNTPLNHEMKILLVIITGKKVSRKGAPVRSSGPTG